MLPTIVPEGISNWTRSFPGWPTDSPSPLRETWRRFQVGRAYSAHVSPATRMEPLFAQIGFDQSVPRTCDSLQLLDLVEMETLTTSVDGNLDTLSGAAYGARREVLSAGKLSQSAQ